MCEVFGFGSILILSTFAAGLSLWVVSIANDDCERDVPKAPALASGDDITSTLLGGDNGTCKQRVSDVLLGIVVQ